MERRLREEEVMRIEVLAERGVPKRAIARTLGVAERLGTLSACEEGERRG